MKKSTCIWTTSRWKWLPLLPLSIHWKEPGTWQCNYKRSQPMSEHVDGRWSITISATLNSQLPAQMSDLSHKVLSSLSPNIPFIFLLARAVVKHELKHMSWQIYVSLGFTEAQAKELSCDFCFLKFCHGNSISQKPKKLWFMVIYPPNKCLWDAHCVPGIVLHAEDTTMTQTVSLRELRV